MRQRKKSITNQRKSVIEAKLIVVQKKDCGERQIDLDNVFDAIEENLESGNFNPAQDMLDKGYPTSYTNDDGLFVKEFPDGRIFNIDVDIKTGETIYLKQIQ